MGAPPPPPPPLTGRHVAHGAVPTAGNAVLRRGAAETETETAETAAACDYAPLRRDGQCKDSWNLADHVVLFLTHHIAVAGSELAVILRGGGGGGTGGEKVGGGKVGCHPRYSPPGERWSGGLPRQHHRRRSSLVGTLLWAPLAGLNQLLGGLRRIGGGGASFGVLQLGGVQTVAMGVAA